MVWVAVPLSACLLSPRIIAWLIAAAGVRGGPSGCQGRPSKEGGAGLLPVMGELQSTAKRATLRVLQSE